MMRKIPFFAAFFGVLLAGCETKNTQSQNVNAAIPIVPDTVKAQKISYYDEYPATVVALNQVTLMPQVSGYITGIFFKEGERVRKGQKLYAIDAQTYDANYAQAQANLAVQEANLDKAQKDADRYNELAKQDAVARQLVDNANAALVAAQKQVEAAKAAIKGVQTAVRYTSIVAPFDGTIGISQVRLGASVSAGQTVLNTISSDNPMAVDIVIDQSELYHFEKLREVTAKDSCFMLVFREEAYPYFGYISTIDRAVDALSATIKVRFTFPNVENLLRAGMSGKLLVKNNAPEASLIIPHKAIVEQLGEFFVYIVRPDKTVTQTRVKLGKTIGRNVLIKEGLQAGDVIAVEGVQNLKEGSLVTTEQPKQPQDKK